MQYQGMVRKDGLRFAQQPLRFGVATLGEETLDARHEREDPLFVCGSGGLYRSHVHV